MKMIHPTNRQINALIATIREDLKKGKAANGKIDVQYLIPVPKNTKKAELIYSEQAANKIKMLVNLCSDEVGWHGTAHRDEKENNIFYIDDIFVFPQEVTGTTVTPDETEYAMWLAGLEDDTFNHLRFHGHSHVNMNTNPSGTDTSYQSDMLQNLEDFYIFGIFNKRDDNWMTIYDVENNIIYEDEDIIYENKFNPEATWAAAQIKEHVTKKTYSYNNKKNTKPVKNNKRLSPGEKAMKETKEELETREDKMWWDEFYGPGRMY